MLVRRLSEIYISLFSWCCESFSSEPQLVQSQGSVWVMETQSSKLKNVSNNFCPVLTFLNATMSTVILLKSTLLPQLLFPQSFRECPSNLSFLLLCSLSSFFFIPQRTHLQCALHRLPPLLKKRKRHSFPLHLANQNILSFSIFSKAYSTALGVSTFLICEEDLLTFL